MPALCGGGAQGGGGWGENPGCFQPVFQDLCSTGKMRNKDNISRVSEKRLSKFSFLVVTVQLVICVNEFICKINIFF